MTINMRLQIFDLENWKEIGATLSRNKTRTFLTGFGIFWGVAIMAILLGGASGGEDMLRRQFAGFATNTAAVIPGTTTMPYKGTPKGYSVTFDLTDVERIRQAVPEMEIVLPIFSSWGSVSCRNGRFAYSGTSQGVSPEYAKVITPIIFSGRFINEADVAQERKVVCLGQKIVNEIFPGDPSPIGKPVQINGVTYTIIGVVGSMSDVSINGRIDEMAMLPSSTFRRAFGRGDGVDFMVMLGRENVKLKDVLPRVRSVLARRHDYNPDDPGAVWTMDVSEQFEMADKLFTGVDMLALFIGLSTLLAGVIGIGNIMWIIVKERTQEIGIRRAIGAKPRDIIVQVLSEGMALTVLFGLAGITLATVVLAIAHHLTNQDNPVVEAHFQMSFALALEIVALFAVLGTLAGIIPSIKAMRIKPIEALNSK